MITRSTVPFAEICISVVFAAALLLMSGHVLTVNADCPGEPDTPCDNGDVNADGNLDIADAVSLLQYLFGSGAAPVTIECQECPARSSNVPPSATGQRLCYDTTGALIDCDNDDWPRQDGFYQNGCPMEGRFVDNGDGTVTDNCTGLMWQQETAPGRYAWEEALRYCENLELREQTDWRLPNIRELQSIVDYGRSSPAIDPVFTAESSQYHSSSTIVHDTPNAWYVNFIAGSVDAHRVKSLRSYVRAVRTIQSGE